jgi:hypothetical protein
VLACPEAPAAGPSSSGSAWLTRSW